MCKFGSQEASGSLRPGNLWVEANLDRLQSWQISSMLIFIPITTDSSQMSRILHFFGNRSPKTLNRESYSCGITGALLNLVNFDISKLALKPETNLHDES